MCKYRFTENISMILHRCENSGAKDTILLSRVTELYKIPGPFPIAYKTQLGTKIIIIAHSRNTKFCSLYTKL